jgi:hypothetical protein
LFSTPHHFADKGGAFESDRADCLDVYQARRFSFDPSLSGGRLLWELSMNEGKPWTPSSIALMLAGVALIGTGFYFIVLRPALLPEDVRYMALPAAQFDVLRPRLEAWLTQVFRVMGGFVFATGVLAVTLAATSFRAHQSVAALGALIAGGASIGWMAAVNFLIDSDFKWVLLGMALLWACSLVLFWFESKTSTQH